MQEQSAMVNPPGDPVANFRRVLAARLQQTMRILENLNQRLQVLRFKICLGHQTFSAATPSCQK